MYRQGCGSKAVQHHCGKYQILAYSESTAQFKRKCPVAFGKCVAQIWFVMWGPQAFQDLEQRLLNTRPRSG